MATSSTFTAADGDGYELQMGRWSRRLVEPFLDFVGTTDGERALDVGCGTGNLALGWAGRARLDRLVGVDFSPIYARYAASRTSDPRLSFERACQIL